MTSDFKISGFGRRCLAVAVCLLLAGCRPAASPEPNLAETQPYAPPPPASVNPAYVAAHPERWRPVEGEALTPEGAQDAAAQLEAIGYLPGSTPPPARSGVLIHDATRMDTGYNLYTSGHAPEAVLMDSSGQPLHAWRKAFLEVWPELKDTPHQPQMSYWRHVHCFPDGSLLAIFDGIGLIKLDRDSNILWKTLNQAHHDLDVAPDGDLYVLTRDAHIVPQLHPSAPILEDYFCILSTDGKEKKRVSLLECLSRSDKPALLDACRGRSGDLFHTNAIRFLDARMPGLPHEFSAGRILTSIRELDTLAVIDLEQARAVWVFQEKFKRQHDPTLLENGHLLLFDNRGPSSGSAVLEFNLTTSERVWTFEGSTARPFYTESCGSAQRLTNGNTLILESDRGHAFELTPDGTVVWEFFNPHRAGERQQFIATLFQLERISGAQAHFLAPRPTAG